jgi:hypothetical protein
MKNLQLKETKTSETAMEIIMVTVATIAIINTTDQTTTPAEVATEEMVGTEMADDTTATVEVVSIRATISQIIALVANTMVRIFGETVLLTAAVATMILTMSIRKVATEVVAMVVAATMAVVGVVMVEAIPMEAVEMVTATPMEAVEMEMATRALRIKTIIMNQTHITINTLISTMIM